MSAILKGQYIFLAHARTASVAIEDALIETHGAISTFNHHEKLSGIDQSNELTFCVIRNPYDILATWFQLVGIHSSIKEMCQQYQHSFFRNTDGKLFSFHAPISDYIIRYENLEPEINNFLSVLDLAPIKLKRLNVTEGKKPYRDYYSPEDIKYVEEHFPEIGKYGYTF